jgi:hypothetical protein
MDGWMDGWMNGEMDRDPEFCTTEERRENRLHLPGELYERINWRNFSCRYRPVFHPF